MFNFQFQGRGPCQNCPRFHYGYCRDAPRQCWRCNDYNHVERYCPRRRTRWPRDLALPGTRHWCSYHGLDSDPTLRSRVLNALKTSPSCNIYIDGYCIYKGCVEHHFRHEQVRGRPLAERMTRRRSRSPDREQIKRGRSRSPLRRRSPLPIERRLRQASPIRQNRGRSESLPQQQRQSPPRTPLRPRGRSPVFNVSGIAFSQANEARTGMEIFRPSFLQHQSLFASPKQVSEKQQMQQSIKSVVFSNIIKIPSFLVSGDPLCAISGDDLLQETEKDGLNYTQQQQPVLNENGNAQETVELYIEDPHFILGVRKDALEKEILEAYQQSMWEIERQRIADTDYKEPPGPDNVWDQSVAQLRAAKKMLIGY
ncbi:hypothetical protein SBOR_5115 [Sclerotinia borealis F-4128]|uniref:Uncharacterized protein n=1 Tax=Sclerotinia borealis (strain F-4128) TaxID=1432307 RepID=W9CCL7_SCLBF|nr:hypothetical protein SBOR_5115 [Sclerotinia borealis F-4128]